MPLQAPFGDIVEVKTPYIDRAAQQLYQEQKTREAYRQKQNEALGTEFKALLPGIRTGDTNKFAELYNDYKTSWQQLHSKPPQDQKEYLKAQQELLKKKAAMYNHVTNSKLKAAQERSTGTVVMGDKTGLFRDDAHNILAQGMQLPYDEQLETTDPQTGQKVKIDWTDPDALKRHIDTKGVMDAIKFSTGADQKYSGDKFKVKPTDIQYTQPEITVKNKPTQFYENMKIAATKDPRSFLNTLPHPTADEYFNVEKHYNEVMTPEVRKQWRMDAAEDLPPDDNLTDLEKAIKYQAMAHAIGNLPRVINKQLADRDVAMEKAQANRQANIRLAAGLGYGIWQNKERFKSEAAAAGVALRDVDADGLFLAAVQPDRSLKLDPTFLGDDPDMKDAQNLKLSNDGKNVEFEINYYKDGKITETKKDSRPVAIVKKKMIHDLGLKDSKVPPAAPKKTSYNYNGKTFSASQIEKAAKQSNLSTDEYLKKYNIK